MARLRCILHRSMVALGVLGIAAAQHLACASFTDEAVGPDGGTASGDAADGASRGDDGGVSASDAGGGRRCASDAKLSAGSPVVWAKSADLSSVRRGGGDPLSWVTIGKGTGATLGAYAVDEGAGTFTPQPSRVAALVIGGSGDEQPAISDDGLTLWFISRRGGKRQLHRGTRASAASDFAAPALVTVTADGSIVSAANDEVQDSYAAHGRVYFTVTRGSADKGRLIEVAVPDSVAPTLLTSTKVPGLDTGVAFDEHPVVSADGLEIWFGSLRGGGDKSAIFHARRASVDGTFGDVGAVVSENGVALKPTWVSPDACDLYYFRDDGNAVLQRATRR